MTRPFDHQPGGAPFSFAGIWARNDKLDVTSCSFVTMPAVYKEWLDTGTPVAKAKELLTETLDGQLEFHRLSRDVNSSRFEGKPEINPL